MKFMHITIADDKLNIPLMREKVGADFGRYFIKDEPIYNKFTGEITKKKQKTNRWCYSRDTRGQNINATLSSFLKILISNQGLKPFLMEHGAVIEIVTYFDDERSSHQITIDHSNLELLSQLNAKLVFVPIDF